MNIIHHVFARYKKFSTFVDFANSVLIDIESLRLDYCKVKTLPKAAWVGENVMAYMRLFSYLYGMFLSIVGLGKEDKETTRRNELNLRRMINALQALLSVLMSDQKIKEEVIDDHMKLFMSTAHFLHDEYGYLGMTMKEDNDKNTKATKKDLISGLSKNDCATILEEFGTDPESKLSQRRAQVKKFTVPELRKKCKEQGIDNWDKLKKDDLISALLEKVLMEDANGIDGDSPPKPKIE